MTPGSKFRIVAALAVLACAMNARNALAYRPFDGTDAAVAGPAETEIELGPVGYLVESSRSVVAPALVYNYGFADRWEAVLEGQGEHPVSGPSRSSTIVGNGAFLKGVLRDGVLQDRPGPSVATEFGLLLPGFNDEPGLGASLAGIVSNRWQGLTVHLNASLSVSRAGNPDLFLGAILEGPWDWTVRPVAEVFYERQWSVSEIQSALVGAIWHSGSGPEYDAAVRTATESGRHTAEFRAGVTFGFAG
jgi:hypothetical protein